MNGNTKKITLSAFFLVAVLALPFLTGQIPQVGSMLCPMHIPVLLCGFICGWQYGAIVGFIAPLLRSVCFGMPPIFPTATCMAFELAAYGLVAGLAYKLLPKKKFLLYPELLVSMIAGRLVWGLVMFVCLSATSAKFTFAAFLSGAVLNAVPGIVLQILIIPPLVSVINDKVYVDNVSGRNSDRNKTK